MDLLVVVEKSRIIGRVHLVFNSTFIVAIPKVENGTNLDDYKAISLCNCIYKLINKVIARRI